MSQYVNPFYDPLTGPRMSTFQPSPQVLASQFYSPLTNAGSPSLSSVANSVASMYPGSAPSIGSINGSLASTFPTTYEAGVAAARPAASTLAAMVPEGVGAEAATAANALRGAGAVGAAGAGEGLGARLLGGFGGGEAAGLAGKAGFQAGVGRWLPGALGESGLATGLASVAAPTISGMAADKLFGKEDESVGRQLARGFTRGAGWAVPVGGALAATGVGALADVPLAAIAAGTGTVGALLDVFDAGKLFGGGGDKKPDWDAPKANRALLDMMGQAAVDPLTAQKIMDTYAVQLKMVDNAVDADGKELSDKDKTAQRIQAYNNAQQLILQSVGSGYNTMGGIGGLGGGVSDPAQLLALQQAAGDIFNPIAQDIASTNDVYQQAMATNMGNLPADYQAVARAQMAQATRDSKSLADAYKAQAAITPVVQRLTQYQQDRDSLANQLWSQMMSQNLGAYMQGGAGLGGGGTDIASLLAAQGGQ